MILHAWQEAHRRWPSYRELIGPMGYRSISPVDYWVKEGARLGVVIAAEFAQATRQTRPNYANIIIERTGDKIAVYRIVKREVVTA